MHLPKIPLSLSLLLQALAPPVQAWDHLDRSHPSQRTPPTFRWTRPFLDLDLHAIPAAADSFRSTTSPTSSDRDVPGGFHVSCQATATFRARQYTAADLRKPWPETGLAPWADAVERSALDGTGSSAYPGGWEGDELHGADRTLLLMELTDVPPTVRAFVEHEGVDGWSGRRWLFGIYDKPGAATGTAAAGDKVMIFAPGALYDILPLWVADSSRCRMQLVDLDKYTMTFEIKAALLLETVQGRRYREAWENVHLQASRAERRLQRQEREEGKGRHRVHGKHDEL
ncbi:hypothetical protein MAPG_03682 [Magnaporthiopsis poae ATCC 64411]|uniref:Uncharacterized protein n=1 Tax=Magnaporthiopsis poae (strain ATCC 64411 / 73-15) TaxID=644358 RepID=A0A0C4DUP1_MAGP6|nr:hypothetical protein MAPG_03682 [Magnaporthiopsis poae ATCC 64411]